MADLFDYIRWRGDIPFSQRPVNPVDALIFSTLSYVSFRDVVPEEPGQWVYLSDAAQMILALSDAQTRVRVKDDLELLRVMAEAPRFRRVGVSFYRDEFIPEEETQFAAVTFYLEDGSALLAFRGTDRTLVGWKEDFNMTFQESVPAQRKALQYVTEFGTASSVPLYLAGHSKGGNAAVYAAARCAASIQDRIVQVYNQDGPGFTETMLRDPGYLHLVPKIQTYVPQSSVVGMLLEHEEPYRVIKSNQIGGFLQHNPYSWEVLGPDLVYVEQVTADSVFISQTMKTWLASMDKEERNAFVDAVFELFAAAGADQTGQLIQPKQVLNYLRTLNMDDNTRRLLAGELTKLLIAVWSNMQPERD